jgi:hypothetical protein
MTLPLRRALALFFAGLFVIVALISIAYGRGYRFDTRTQKISLTGVIFLAGSPNRIQLLVDDEEQKNVSFPTTIRGLLPTTHTVNLGAAGYASQVFTVSVRSGQTTFVSDVQLYRTKPLTSVRTGIPKQAQLSPDGSTVAWLENNSLAIADALSIKRFNITAETEALSWSENSEDIILQNESRVVLAVVSKAGVIRDKSYILTTGDKSKIDLLLNGRMKYTTIQTIPGSAGWLLTDESSAWVLQPNGNLSLATRWGNSIINVIHLGHESLASVRSEEIIVRNISNGQTALYELPGITQATAGKHEGELNLLVADGDLIQWQRGNFF